MSGGNTTATLSYLKGGSRGDRDRLFPDVCSKRMRSNKQVTAKEIPTGHRNFSPSVLSNTENNCPEGWEASGLGTYCCVLALKIDHFIPLNFVYSL